MTRNEGADGRGVCSSKLGALMATFVITLTGSVFAQPIWHERLDENLSEDASLSEPGQGEMSGALRTATGVVSAPDLSRPPATAPVLDGSELDPFRPDRDTRRPEVEQYHDPFTPALTPFKRSYAYDAVRPDYSLYVRDGVRRPIRPGGRVKPSDDAFFADLSVMFVPGQSVRLPTVGPDARLLKLTTLPKVDVRLSSDGAGNWFASTDASGRVRLVMELAIERQTYAGTFSDVPWSALPPPAIQPARHRQAATKVARAIGVSRATMRPREVVEKMVAYFRSFEASDELPSEYDDIYLALALSQKGVCRHRAFAFLVTALNLGIPARLIHNEAHAWVEVFDASLWRRIDLGGTPAELSTPGADGRPIHQPPPDTFPWPKGRDAGTDIAQRMAQQEDKASKDGAAESGGDPQGQPAEANEAPPGPALPSSAIEVLAIDHDVFRGLPLKIRGQVTGAGARCAGVRVDVTLRIADQEQVIGALSTDEQGVFDGSVVVPSEAPTGDHQLSLSTRGSLSCGPGATE